MVRTSTLHAARLLRKGRKIQLDPADGFTNSSFPQIKVSQFIDISKHVAHSFPIRSTDESRRQREFQLHEDQTRLREAV